MKALKECIEIVLSEVCRMDWRCQVSLSALLLCSRTRAQEHLIMRQREIYCCYNVISAKS